MIERAMVEADLTFRPEAEGGRTIPPGVLDGLQYRPHIVVGDPNQREAIVGADRVIAEEYLGVAFSSGPDRISLGHAIRVEMMLIYWPNLDYRKAVPGATFTLREGGRNVGRDASPSVGPSPGSRPDNNAADERGASVERSPLISVLGGP